MTNDEQKLKAIRSILDSDFIASKNRYGNETAQKIISALKPFDPEPLEVTINRGFWNPKINNWDFRIHIFGSFDTEEQTIDFCAKHGFRVRE